MNRKWISGGLGLGLAVFCALAFAAGVNGIFGHVTSATGYQVSGAAGTSAQALCGDGTNYDTACPVYQTIEANATAAAQEPKLNLISGTYTNVTCADNSGSTRTDCTISNVQPANACSALSKSTTQGCTILPDGTWQLWFLGPTISTDPSAPEVVTLPLTFPTGCYTSSVSTYNPSPTDTNISYWEYLSCTTNTVSLYFMRNSDHAYDPIAPMLIVLGH